MHIIITQSSKTTVVKYIISNIHIKIKMILFIFIHFTGFISLIISVSIIKVFKNHFCIEKITDVC